MRFFEVNFDGLVGPTHNYAGLSFGNEASFHHKGEVSSPKKAALQGLEKMKTLFDLGVKQAFFPPHKRPHPLFFKDKKNPHYFSASSMWVANIGTFTPSLDSEDGRAHLTAANLLSNEHRKIESSFSSHLLKRIFFHKDFIHHEPLEKRPDEGAANHMRFYEEGKKGVHVFVYGKESSEEGRYPRRQSLSSSKEISRIHQIPESHLLFAKQNPEAIDEGVFHNDVISVGHENFLFVHEKAFFHQKEFLKNLKRKLPSLRVLEVLEKEVSLKESVDSYLFNSQIVTSSSGDRILICPKECEYGNVFSYLQKITSSKENPFSQILFQDLRESMKNGGGPACLRWRAFLSEKEFQTLPSKLIFDLRVYEELKKWIHEFYEEEILFEKLMKKSFLEKTEKAFRELAQIIEMEDLYDFGER